MKKDKTPKLDNNILKIVFVDTCVIQDIGSSDKNKSEAVIQAFELLSQEGYNFAISEFTIYENLQGLWGKKAELAGLILAKYQAKVVSREVLVIASFLQGLYHDEKYDNISDGDKIIAATSILENGFVLTRNHKDFPSPFFLVEKWIPVSYKKGRINQTIDLSLYKPNLVLIGRRVGENDNK